MGFGGDASLRTEAGLTFELSHNREAGGHVFLPREKLLAATAQLLDCDVDAVEKASTISSPSTASCRKASRM